jgi:hypothetical protein
MLTVLVESEASAELLGRLLGSERDAGLLRLQSSPVLSSLYASAKTLIVVRQQPVALVLDAKSTEPSMADRAWEDAAEVVGDPGRTSLLCLLVAVPAIEALLFRCPDAVRRVFPEATDDLMAIGRVSPRDALVRLGGSVAERHQASVAVIDALNAENLAALRLESPVRELLEFVAQQRHQSRDAVTTGT